MLHHDSIAASVKRNMPRWQCNILPCIVGSDAAKVVNSTCQHWPWLLQQLIRNNSTLSSSKSFMPRTVNDVIKACSTVQQLQQLLEQHHSKLSVSNLATAIVQLPKLQQAAAQHMQKQQHADMSGHRSAKVHMLDQLWQQLQPSLHYCTPRQLGRVIWASSKIQNHQLEVYSSCLEIYTKQVDADAPRYISNVIYALCTAPAGIRGNFTRCINQQLLPVFQQKLADANPQAISNVLYGLAVGHQQPDQQQVQQLLVSFVKELGQAKPQEVSNTIWAVAKLGQHVQPEQLQQLLDVFVTQLEQAKPQEISNTLLAVASMGQQVKSTQLQQMLGVLVTKLDHAKPQEISNTLLAVAKIKQQVEHDQLQQLLDAVLSKVQKAIPQDISNTLWAVASMGQQMQTYQLQHMLFAFVRGWQAAKPQEASNILLACAKMNFSPNALLSRPLLADTLCSGNSQDLANPAWACGQLGHKDLELMERLLRQMLTHIAAGCSTGRDQGKSSMQELCNMCWAVAVLDLGSLALQLRLLVQACSKHWQHVEEVELMQLYQVHVWLQDTQPAGCLGLQRELQPEQLLQCKAAWDKMVSELATQMPNRFQREVFAALNQLDISWQQPPQMEQLSTAADGTTDGLLCIDISGLTAGGVKVAVEADGPSHYRQPDGQPTGPTLYRNRALRARGYTLVVVPYYDWGKLQSSKQRQEYLTNLLKQAGVE